VLAHLWELSGLKVIRQEALEFVFKEWELQVEEACSEELNTKSIDETSETEEPIKNALRVFKNQGTIDKATEPGFTQVTQTKKADLFEAYCAALVLGNERGQNLG